MGTSKIKFLREGKGKIGLKGKSYSFRRLKEIILSAPFKNKPLGKTNPVRFDALLYSDQDLFLDFNCMGSDKNALIRKSKDQILKYLPESFKEMEIMKEVIIRNRSPIIILETNNFSIRVGSKLLVTELLTFGSTLVKNIQNFKNLNILSIWLRRRYLGKLESERERQTSRNGN